MAVQAERRSDQTPAPETAPVILRAEGLTKQVSSPEGPLTILDDVSLEIRRGEAVALVGPSGAGKTTLLALLAGLDQPTRGRIWLGSDELTALDEDGRAMLRARRVGFVFQSLENVMLPLELAGDPGALEQATATLGQVGLASRIHHYPRQLSGGEQQRVAVARAFVTGPEVLFADEPTGNLDTATGEKIVQLLFDLNARTKTTLVLVTHERELAARCDRVITVVGGRIA
jgi:putative ABC transport system ATP-binding protein